MRKWIALGVLISLMAGLWLPAAAEGEMELLLPAPGERLTDDELSTYYQGALFIGDSITAQLMGYVRRAQKEDANFFPDVRFQTAQSYFLYTASRKGLQSGTANLKYRGIEMPMWQVLQEMQPKKALILLGVNDYIGTEIEKGIGYCRRILELAAQYAPDTEIIFESLTPVTRSFCRKKDYQKMWDEYNEALKAMCAETGTAYIDIASSLKNADGYLNAEYSNDGKFHLNAQGMALWIESLLDFAQEQYEKGLWVPQDWI